MALTSLCKKDISGEIPRYLVFFKGRDADVITAAFREFSAKNLEKEKKAFYPQGVGAGETAGQSPAPPAGEGQDQRPGCGIMTVDWKKKLLPNIPYLLFVYLFDKLCQAVRLAPGLDASEKFLHLSQDFTEAFSYAAPSLHPLDLLCRACSSRAAATIAFAHLSIQCTILRLVIITNAFAITVAITDIIPTDKDAASPCRHKVQSKRLAVADSHGL